jgi:hypothetical protein
MSTMMAMIAAMTTLQLTGLDRSLALRNMPRARLFSLRPFAQSIRSSAKLRSIPPRTKSLGCETAGATWGDGESLRSLCSAAGAEGHDGESDWGAWVCKD